MAHADQHRVRPRTTNRRAGTRRRTSLAAIALTAVITGCGTTVPSGGMLGAGDSARPGQGAAPELGGPVADGFALPDESGQGVVTTPGTAGGPGGSVTGPAGGGASGAESAAGAPQGGAGASGSAAGTAAGSPVSGGELKIGITLLKNGEAFVGSVGASNAAFGDSEAQAEAVVRYINGTGGIAGRRVKPVYHTFDLASGCNEACMTAAACARWTEDERVFATVNTNGADPNLFECLAKAGVPSVNYQMPVDEQLLAKYHDYYYSVGHAAGLTLDRQARESTRVFHKRGWFGPDAVVGIMHFDTPAHHRVVSKEFLPELKAAGVGKVVVEASADFVQANYNSVVLRFRTEGVTHVMFLGQNGGYPLMFMNAAEAQGFRPKYGLRTDNFPASIAPSVPTEQLRRVTGMGWQPTLDVAPENDPPRSAPGELCMRIMKDAGQDMSQRGAEGTALAYCDGLFFLRKSLGSAAQLSVAGMSSAVAGLDRGYQSPLVFGTRFSRSRHDGVDAVRPIDFRDDCSCLAYSGPEKRLS